LEEKNYNPEHNSPLWGISTSHLADKQDFASLLAYEPSVIEFYNYPDIDPIVKFCDRHNIIPALHVPTPYNGRTPLTRFCPTASGTAQEIEAAIEMTRTTISCAADIGALHVVVHFPTPFPPYYPITDSEIAHFFENVCDHANSLNVNLLIENLTPNPHFYTPDHYLRLWNDYNLHACLDVGHAHLLEPTFSVQDYIENWQNAVKSVHLYNMTKERYSSYGHEPIEVNQSEADGWINMKKTLDSIITKCNPRAIILEYNPMDAKGIKKSAKSWKDFKHREFL